MLVTVRLFARLRELTGSAELQRTVPDGSTALDVWNALAAEFPALTDYSKAISVAVNRKPPSPSIATTWRSGKASFAPIAARRR